MNNQAILQLIQQYKAAGWTACLYPRLRRVSLNGGRSVPVSEGVKRIKECLQNVNQTKGEPNHDTESS